MNFNNRGFSTKATDMVHRKNSFFVLMSVFMFLILAIIYLIINSQSKTVPVIILVLALAAASLSYFIFNLDQKAVHPVAIDDYINERKHFINLLSHDLRSPLGSIILLTSMISRGDKYPEIKPFMEMIEKSARKELDLLGTLLLLMKSSTKLSNPDEEISALFEQVLIEELVDKSISQVKDIIKTKKVNLNINIADDLKVCIDPASFGLVLNALLMNAIEFSGPETIVEINSTENEQHVVLEVIDQGPGFNQETGIPSFESATINDKTRFRESADVIGLYFCSKIMQYHQGSIQAYSDGPATGARFQLILPRIKEKISA